MSVSTALRVSTVGTRILKFPCFPLLLQTYSSTPHSQTHREIGFYNTGDANTLHGEAIKKGFMGDLQFCNHLLNLYGRKCDVAGAQKLFDEMPDRDVRSWTILIKGFARVGRHEVSLDLFKQMQMQGIFPNCYTLSCIMNCCASIMNLKIGKAIHGWIIGNGVKLDVSSENSIVDFYVQCGAFDCASRVFELMKEKDTVSWNIMIGGYLQNGDTEKSIELFRRLPVKDVASWNTIIVGQMRNGFSEVALELLRQMRESGFLFNERSFSIALLLAASQSMLDLGKQIHGQLLRTGFYQHNFIRNSLIDMYSKCGEMRKASIVLSTMHQNSDKTQPQVQCQMENTVSWSSIISGYVQKGNTEEAFKLFRKMVREGVEVNQFTLTSLVSACSDVACLEQGTQFHAFAKKLGYQHEVFLVSALVDMYCKCGSLDDALSIFFESRLTRNTVLWTSLISGCGLHGKGREVTRLFELMLKEGIKPNEVSFLGLLSGCSHAGLVEEGKKYFRMMKEDYRIDPGVEHFTCMVGLLGREGNLMEAKKFIQENNISHLIPVWKAFLTACNLHKNAELATWASKKLLHLEPDDAGSYILLSNISTVNCRWEDAAGIRSLMQNKGVKKISGQSWVQLKN